MSVHILQGHWVDALCDLKSQSVHCVVSSPPYWGLRSYLPDGHPLKAFELGNEPTLREYVAKVVDGFESVRRVLRDDGTLWLNIGDTYANDSKWGGATGGKHAEGLHGNTGVGRGKRDSGLKAKDLCGVPWRVAFALQDAGWYLRCDIVWEKPTAMPEPALDRPAKSHLYSCL
jgi:DNA modification methylase